MINKLDNNKTIIKNTKKLLFINNRIKKNKNVINSLDTFRKNKEKYISNNNILHIINKNKFNKFLKKDKKINFNIKKKFWYSSSSIYSHISENIINDEKKKIKFNFKKSINIFKSIDIKKYNPIKLKKKLQFITNNTNYNDYFNHKNKVNQISKEEIQLTIKNNIKNYIQNSKKFDLNFKKKDVIELIDYENSVLNSIENFKKLDNIYYELKSKKRILYFQNIVKKSIMKNNLSKMSKYKNKNDWKEIFIKVLNFCINNNLQKKNNINSSTKKLKLIKKNKKKYKFKKENRIFNRENKIKNNVYYSLWVNIIDNILQSKDQIKDVGYYKLKGWNNNSYSHNTLWKLESLKFDINDFINKINDDLDFDHKKFKIYKK